MEGGALRISNANYDATALLERVRGLLARDAHLLGGVVLKSALMRSIGPDVQHVMTRVEVLPKSQDPGSACTFDYGNMLFVTEVLNQEGLLKRLSELAEKRFSIGPFTVTSTGIGFSDRLEAGGSSGSPWSHLVFDVYFG